MTTVCRQCGQGAEDGVEFCPSCGAFLEWEGEAVGPAAGGSAGEERGPAARSARPPASDPGPPPGQAASRARWRGRDTRDVDPGPPEQEAPPPPTDWTGGTPWSAGSDPGATPAPPRPGETRHRPAPMPGSVARSSGSVVCLECGGRNEPDRRFCRRCGSSLDLVALSGPPSTTVVPPEAAVPEVPHDPGAGARGGLAARSPAAPVPVPPSHVEGRPPSVAARPPVPGVAPGQQPAEARPRPAPMRPQRAEAEVAPGGPLCGQCGTANPPGRRFCRHCGAAVAGGGPDLPAPLPSPGRASWWQRVRGRSPDTAGGDATPSRAARAAYRRTLDVRYRVMRVLAVVAGVGLLAGSLGLAGVNPIAGARGLWDRFFPRDRQVGELTAAADPAEVVQPDFQPGSAVDGDSDTAWATPWTAEEGAPPPEACAAPAESGADGGAPGTGGAESALEVTLPEATEVSKIEVQPGLAAGDPARATQRSPSLLELRFDDGSCTTIELADEAGFQDHRLDGPETTTVRIAVLDSAPATDQAASQGLVAIGEVRIFTPR